MNEIKQAKIEEFRIDIWAVNVICPYCGSIQKLIRDLNHNGEYIDHCHVCGNNYKVNVQIQLKYKE